MKVAFSGTSAPTSPGHTIYEVGGSEAHVVHNVYFSATKVLIGSGNKVIKVDLSTMQWSELVIDSNFQVKDLHFLDPATNDA